MTRMSIACQPAREVVLVIAALVGIAACSKSDTAADTTSITPAPAAAPAAASAIGDAQVAHIAVTANAIDSTAGELAKQKASAKAVKDFAQTMVTDHGGVNQQAVALATKLGVTPADNDVSRSLKSGADANLSALQGLNGAAFDKAYIGNEVAYHQAVLDALDKTLIPSSQNAELRGLLEKVRPAFVAHLDHAKKVQAGLPK